MTLSRHEAFRRRIARLAFLLTGDHDRAVAMAASILRRRSNADTLDAAHLDRLVILDARRIRPRPDASTPDAAAHARLLSLPPQPREAWILTRLDGLDELAVAKSMDCSRTAVRLHLSVAEQALGQDAELALALALARLSDSVKPGDDIATRESADREERRRRMLVVLSIVVLASAAGVAVVVSGVV